MTDTEEGRVSVAAALRALEQHEWVDRSGGMLLANKTIAETIRTLARQLAEANAAKEAAERRAAEVEALLREVSLNAWGQNGPLDLLNKRPLLERIDAAIAAGEKGNAD